MKILESAPYRYDKGIRLLTFGQIDNSYKRLASYVERDQLVLDIGCGTGLFTRHAAQRGAIVKGIDVNPQMLDIAQRNADAANLNSYIELCEMGVAELASERSQSYHAVLSGLCFSELTPYELRFTLTEIKRILKPGGLLLIADEVKPQQVLKRILNQIIRFPLILITYLWTQTTTHSLKNLPQTITAAQFYIESLTLNKLENFIEIVARNVDDIQK
jgi:demethylmenaquinone methyltransferase/2-methoxy-6-polyprenyl-1,4-benzoquinol methylase